MFHGLRGTSGVRMRGDNESDDALICQTISHYRILIRKALEKDRDVCYQHASEMRADLKRLKRDIESRKAPAQSAAALVGAKPWWRRTAALMGASICAGILSLSAVWSFVSHAGPKIDSLAVLPFVNVTADPNTEYLSDGLTDSLISNLSQLPDLTVRPRSSVLRYKGKESDPQAAARDLKVAAVISGHVTLRGDALHVGVELTDTRDNRNLWSKQYDRKLSDLLGIELEIAGEVSARLRGNLPREDGKPLGRGETSDPEAYQLYLRGRYYWDKRTPDSLEKARNFFNQAIAKDPGYVLAYVGLADYWNVVSDYASIAASETIPKAKAASQKALSLDDQVSAAHLSLASAYMNSWEWAAAEREFQRTLELDPNLPDGHHGYGLYLSCRARAREAIPHLQRAVELEPFSLEYMTFLGFAYHKARMYDRAIEQAKKTLEMDPNFATAHALLALAYFDLGRYDEWLAERKQTAYLRHDPWAIAAEEAAARGYSRGGYRTALRSLIEEHVEQKKNGSYVDPAVLAYDYAKLGDKEQTLQWLEVAFTEKSSGLQLIQVAPELDPFRSDARFHDLLRRMGLPE